MRALLLVLVAAGCNRAPAMATENDCERWAAHMRSLPHDLPSGMLDETLKQGQRLCPQVYSADHVACMLRARTVFDVEACRPTRDVRPPGERPAPEQCARLEMHHRDLMRSYTRAISPEKETRIAKLAALARGLCEWKTYRTVVECQLVADNLKGLAPCDALDPRR